MPDLQSLLATVSGLSFVGVWLGLVAQIRKIHARGERPPSFHPLLHGLHAGRFAGWAWTGAATLATDPITGWLLLTTRLPGVALVALTFLQRKTPRFSGRAAGLVIGGSLLAVSGVAIWVMALNERLSRDAMPGIGTPLELALSTFVLMCFAVQLLWALPRQIRAAWRQPLGNLRWFQAALLVNYGTHLLYASAVRAEWVQSTMIGVYGVAFAEQAILVFLIERGVRAHRHRARIR